MTDGAPTVGVRDFGFALIVVAHGDPLALCYDGPHHITEYIDESFRRDAGSFAFGDEVDFAPVADGVYIAELLLVDDGTGDWPGSREVALQARNFRPATPAEWTAHLNEEWPWEPFVHVRPRRRQKIRRRCRGCGAFADEPRSDRCEIGDVGHCDIDVDQNGRLLPWSVPEADARDARADLDAFERRELLDGDDE